MEMVLRGLVASDSQSDLQDLTSGIQSIGGHKLGAKPLRTLFKKDYQLEKEVVKRFTAGLQRKELRSALIEKIPRIDGNPIPDGFLEVVVDYLHDSADQETAE